MLWMTNSEGACIYLSRSWYEFTGQTPVTGLRFGWLDSVHPDEHAETEARFMEANQQHAIFQVEYRLRKANGEYVWMLDTAHPRFEDGEFIGYVGSVIDINERKVTAEALRDRENRYQQLFSSIDEGFVICQMIFDENRKPIDYRFLEANESFGINTGLPMPYALGRTARELVPNLEDFWFETYGGVVLSGEPTRFEQHSQSMHRWFDAYAFPVGGDLFAILFTDITERRRAQIRAHLLQTLAAALSVAQTVDEVIKTILVEGVKPLASPKGVIGLLTPDGQKIEIKRMIGYSKLAEERWRSIRVDDPTIPFALAVREGTPLWLGSPEERLARLPLTPNRTAEEMHRAWAVLPLKVGKTLIGVLGLGFDEETVFDEGEQTFLLTLADYSAQALERARLSEQANLSAADAERQRLARDLHDSVSQLLFASTSITEGLSRTWERDTEKGRARTDQVLTLNRAAMAEMRKLLLELRPEAILRTPFYELLEQLVRALRGLKEIDIELTFNAPTDLIFPHDVHVAMYRMAQEALNNAGKHSYATQIEVRCVFDSALCLTVSDNGVGFDPAKASMGIGMNSIRERAHAVGAVAHVVSAPGEGTTLTVTWQPKGAVGD